MLLALSILMRTAHLIAGAVWVGGSVIYLAVIIPGLRLGAVGSQTSAAIAALFRRVVNICIGVELLTGVYLIFDRLSTVSVGTAYVAVLVVKIVVALAMIVLALYQAQEARRPAKYRGRFWRQVPRWILGLGLLTFVLGATLVGLFDIALAR